MKKITFNKFTVMTVLLLIGSFVSASEKTFFVSPSGNDSNRGDSTAPFRTVQAAVHAVAQFRTEHPQHTGAVRVQLADGIYELDKTLELDGRISGSLESPTLFCAAPGAKPVISGGRRLSGWKKDSNGYWQLTLDDVKKGKWYFTQLFVAGQRRFRPRLPKQGTYTIASVLPADKNNLKPDKTFGFHDGQASSKWTNLHDVEALVCHSWTMSRNRIESIDEEKKTLTVQGSSPSGRSWGKFKQGNRWFLENVAEALGDPGQWYLNRTTGVLTYIPRPGEEPDKTPVVAPKIEYIMNLAGEKGRFVRHVSFEGIIFAHSNWTTPPEGCIAAQADITVDGTIRLTGAEECQFIHCGFKHLGHYAIAFGTACRDCHVVRCEFKDIGAGGIRIGSDIGNTGNWPRETLRIPSLTSLSEDDQLVKRIVVSGCRLQYLGRLHPAGIGIWIGHAAQNRIVENEVYDLYYSAVSIGWVWGYGKSLANRNIVENNHLHKIGQRFLSDMGAVYTLGISHGTSVSNNKIHDVSSFSYGGWGLYTDEGSTGVEMSHNIVWNTNTGGFHQHYGRDNLITNNIFVNSDKQQFQRSRMEKHRSFIFKNNIVYWTNNSPLLANNWSDGQFDMDYNLYFNPNHEITFTGMTFDEWKTKRGKDLHSVIADPLFVDPANHDYRVKPNSPARGLGFEPIKGPFGPTLPPDLLNDLPEPPVAFPLP